MDPGSVLGAILDPCSKGMKALHALARGDDYARGEEHVHCDSPRAMIVNESKPWFARWSRNAFQNASGKSPEVKERVRRAADLEEIPTQARGQISQF